MITPYAWLALPHLVIHRPAVDSLLFNKDRALASILLCKRKYEGAGQPFHHIVLVHLHGVPVGPQWVL